MATKFAKMLTPPSKQEVYVEIHPDGKPRAPVHSQSHEPDSNQPVALLFVENEELSRTWPRGGRPKSPNRMRSEVNVNSEKTNKSFRTASFRGNMDNLERQRCRERAKLPEDWNEEGALQQERDILDKAFQRVNNHFNKADPLLKKFNNTPPTTNDGINNELQESRQSVINIAKDHKIARKAAGPTSPQSPLPSINIESPLGENTNFDDGTTIPSVCGSMGGDNVTSVASPRESKNGGAGVKSSTKVNMRQGKTSAKGVAQEAVMQKY